MFAVAKQEWIKRCGKVSMAKRIEPEIGSTGESGKIKGNRARHKHNYSEL